VAAEATQTILGMSTAEWPTYLTGTVGVPGGADEVATAVIDRMAERYRDHPPYSWRDRGGAPARHPLAPWTRVVVAAPADRRCAGGRRPDPLVPGQRLHRGGGGREAAEAVVGVGDCKNIGSGTERVVPAGSGEQDPLP
jgi:hypothetical protein